MHLNANCPTKNDIEILIGQAVFRVTDQNSQDIILINNSRIVCPI